MLTIHNRQTSGAIAAHVSIHNILASVLPDQKTALTKDLQTVGKNVAMIGDSINDAPALARAELGIAMGAFFQFSTGC